MDISKIETDVLIIGAGIAGIMAALKSYESNIDIVIATKGPFGRDGAATWMAGKGCQCAHFPPDSPEIHAEETIRIGQYLNNQNLVINLVNVLDECLNKLDKWGLRYLKKDGKILTERLPGAKYPRNPLYERWGRAGGVDYRRILPHQIRTRNIRVLDDFMVVDLLKINSDVVGAIGLDIRQGNIVSINSKVTIIATGGCMGIYSFTTTSPALVGDGYAMALRAGAELSGMEFADFYVSAACWPPALKGEVNAITDLRFDLSGKIFNKRGEEFMLRHKGSPMAFPIVVQREIEEMRASPHGGVYLSFSHLPRNIIQNYIAACGGQKSSETFGEFGIDIYNDSIEIAPAPLESLGGCRINEICETNLGNLFAIGEVAYGAEGAYTMAGNPVALHMASGYIAGGEAGKRVASLRKNEIDKKELRELGERIIEPIHRDKGIKASEIKREIEEILEKFFPLTGKTKASLEKGMNEITRIRTEELPRLYTPVKTQRFNMDLVGCIEAINKIAVLEMLFKSALTREESRGLHFRKDYPELNADWLKEVTIKKTDGDLEISIEPVNLTYFSPKEVKNGKGNS